MGKNFNHYKKNTSVYYIYKLINKKTRGVLYVGYTCLSMNKRLGQHKRDIKDGQEGIEMRRIARKIGINNIGIVKLQTVYTTDRKKVKRLEQRWINKLKGKGNTNKTIR